MPIYMVHAAQGCLTPDVKARLAKAITEVHCSLTGTHTFLVQVTFKEHSRGDVFLGGAMQGTADIFVQGLNRASRAPELKREMTLRLADAVAEASSIPRRHIWVYVDERPASQMVEFGYLLPEPGDEVPWLDGISREDRAYMEEMRRLSGLG